MKKRDVPALLRLSPRLQRYDWGDTTTIPGLLGLRPTGEPCAEAWFGAHPAAPALVREGGRSLPLDQLIRGRQEEVLGAQVSESFGALPYLMKILAAARPLSIQVHPNKEQAAAGFDLEEIAGVPLSAPHRRYKDSNHKPELLVALTDFFVLCGFRPLEEIARVLDDLPELRHLLPGFVPTPGGLRDLLASYFSLPREQLLPALSRLSTRCCLQEAVYGPGERDPLYWAALAHRELCRAGIPDVGMKLVFLLSLVHLRPGQAVYLPPGTPHAYLRGAGVELMASSDNVLRAGLTNKHVDPEELLRVLCFDRSGPLLVEPKPWDGALEEIYAPPVKEFGLSRLNLEPGSRVERRSLGPETLLAITSQPHDHLVVETPLGDLKLGRGEACLVPAGQPYSIRTSSKATVFRALVPQPGMMDDEVRWANGQAERGTPVYVGGVPSRRNAVSLGEHGGDRGFVDAILHNIEATERLFDEGRPADAIGTVSGSEAARAFWQKILDSARQPFGAREAISLHEDLPVGQALGLLLLWQRLRPRLRPGDGALFAFVFGEGTRATPFTEAECGQKPAIRSFVFKEERRERRLLSIVELALRYFALVESHLRRSGFEGVVVKWGDEVQIPTRDLSGATDLFKDADVVRFVSMRRMCPEEALHKDWVGVDEEGRVTAFVPRRPIEEMEALADRGLLQRRDGQLYGGINLGSIALSRALLDVLLEEFQSDLLDPDADRSRRPDLDPQLFTALTIAAISDTEERTRAWAEAKAESPKIRTAEEVMPGILERLRRALDRFEERHGRAVRMVAMDFGDQYWGDIGQHRQIGDFFMALTREGPEGEIARALAGLKTEPDARGNIISGRSIRGASVRASRSVLIDAQIDSGEIEGSVLIGTRCAHIEAREAFDVCSTAPSMRLAPRSGTYRVLSGEHVEASEGERITTVMLPDRELQMRVREDTDLADKARNYDLPVEPNEISFRQAHEQAGMSDPALVEERRARARERIVAELEREDPAGRPATGHDG